MNNPKFLLILLAVSFVLVVPKAARAVDPPALCDDRGGFGAPVLRLPDPSSSEYGAKRDALVNNWYQTIYKANSQLHEQMVPRLDRGDISMKDANDARQLFFRNSFGKAGLILQICEAKRAVAKKIRGFQSAGAALAEKEKGNGLDVDACRGSFSAMVSELSAAVKAYESMDKKIDSALRAEPNIAGAFDRGRRRDYSPITVLKSYYAEKLVRCQSAAADGTRPAGAQVPGCGQSAGDDNQISQRIVREYEALWGHFEYPNATNRKAGGKYSDFLLQLQQEEKRAQASTLPALYKLSDKMTGYSASCMSIVGGGPALPAMPAFKSSDWGVANPIVRKVQGQ